MDFLDKNQMFQIFLEESLDILNDLSHQLLALEKDREDQEVIQNLFRNAHTLKGNSSTIHNSFYDNSSEEEMDSRLKHVNDLSLVTHALENLFTEARDNGKVLTDQDIDILFETEQTLETLLSFIESPSEEEVDIEPIRLKLLQAVESEKTESTTRQEPKTPEPSNASTHTIQIEAELDEDFPFASLSVIYKEIEDNFPNSTFSPSKQELLDGYEIKEVFAFIDTEETLDSVLSFIHQVTFVLKATPLEQPANDTPQKSPEQTQSPKPASVEKASAQAPASRLLSNTSLRVSINRIDEVLKHVSSLVILRNKLLNISSLLDDKQLHDVADEMSQSIDFLQDSVMDIRMTPLDQLFSRFPKDVRNIAKEYQKKVQFECFGGETEIDKSLLDELSKPLIHLIRNSIFHGIESEEEREKAGKPPVGILRLSAKHEQEMVVLTVEDDGKGIDAEAVKRKAIQKGLLSPEKAAKATQEEIINLIFHPGLSTVDTVNSVAGRGVGMDAVRAVVEEMKGHIEVRSTKGKGTKTIINLPLTLAIIPAMLTKIQNRYFSIPSSQIIEAVEIHSSDLRYVANKEVYILREKEIPIVRLNEFFHLSHDRHEDQKLNIVILRAGNKTIGATVDEFISLEHIVVKNIGDYLGSIKGISGCNILGDGSISLLVDVNTLTNSSKRTTDPSE